jgi:hypothetical protein
MRQERSETADPRRLRDCRKCGELLTIFHDCPALALANQADDLAQATIQTSTSTAEDEWAEIRERFPLTASRIIAALEKERKQ